MLPVLFAAAATVAATAATAAATAAAGHVLLLRVQPDDAVC